MPAIAPSGLPERLLELRVRHDPPLTQSQAADLIGVSLRQYGRLERGQADATLQTIRKIAAAYRVEPRLLTGGDPEPEAALPTTADLARVEQKLELLLAHFGLAPVDEGVPSPDLTGTLRYGHHRSSAAGLRRRVGGSRTRGPSTA